MKENKNWRIDTQAVHGGQSPEKWMNATQPPIFQSASHLFDSAERLSDVFAGKAEGDIYARLTNPTNKALEDKLALLENGRSCIVTSSGMAAVSVALMALLRAGDEMIANENLFMSTYLLLTKVLPKYGISARLAKAVDLGAIEAQINDKTRLIYLETIGNPTLDIPDIKRLAGLAHDNDLPLVVDNTLATPYLVKPIELGADIVIHSTTKYLNGHGSAVGGAIIDAGNFSWPESRFPDFAPFKDRKGELAYADKAWREMHINFGTCQAPFQSYLTALGLNTLALRMERHQSNAQSLAAYLKSHPKVEWVNFPGLEDSPSHQVAAEQFGGRGFGALLTFGLKGQAECFKFINSLNMIYHLANLGDCKTLAIHPYSSQYISFTEEQREGMGISPQMIRISVGIEHIDDIIEDLDAALERA